MKNLKKGFTLVEMLIVVVIIGILASAILPKLQGAQAATRDTARKTSLNQIAQGLELYNTSKGSYPVIKKGNTAYKNATQISELIPDYMKSIPMNPNKNAVTSLGANVKSTAGEFLVKDLDNNLNLVLATNVEKADNANWSSDWDFTATSKECGSVVLDSASTSEKQDGVVVAPTEANKKCIIPVNKLVYVLKI